MLRLSLHSTIDICSVVEKQAETHEWLPLDLLADCSLQSIELNLLGKVVHSHQLLEGE